MKMYRKHLLSAYYFLLFLVKINAPNNVTPIKIHGSIDIVGDCSPATFVVIPGEPSPPKMDCTSLSINPLIPFAEPCAIDAPKTPTAPIIPEPKVDNPLPIDEKIPPDATVSAPVADIPAGTN